MPVKLNSEIDKTIPIHQMKDGQLAVVISDSKRPELLQKAVQRVGNKLVVVGESMLYDIWENDIFRVRLLEPGEALVVTSN